MYDNNFAPFTSHAKHALEINQQVRAAEKSLARTNRRLTLSENNPSAANQVNFTLVGRLFSGLRALLF